MLTEDERVVVHQTFRTTKAEDEIIRQKMQVLGIKKKSLLFRSLVLNGYLLMLDLPEIKEVLRLLQNLTNNVNQIAKRLNERGSIYETEIDDLKEMLEQNWNAFREILARLEQTEADSFTFWRKRK